MPELENNIQEPESICQDGDFPEGMLEEWELFLSKEREPLEVYDYGRIFPLQRQFESKKMLEICKTISPKTALEIGADKGGSVWTFLKCIPTLERMIAIEYRGTPYFPLLQKSFPSVKMLGLGESSLTIKCRDKVKNWLEGNKIDVLFIDGDKSWMHKDFDIYLPLMNSYGIVLFHDIQDGPTGASFRQVRDRGYDSLEIIDKRDSINAKVRELQGIECKGSHEQWLRHWNGDSCGVGVIFLGKK